MARWSAEWERGRRTQRRMGNVRLALGVALAAVASAAFGPGWVSAWWLLGPLAPLVVLIALHPRTTRAVQRASRAVAHYEWGIARLEHRWIGKGSAGEELRDAKHLYADDVDLFGRGSLFERVSTARTATGERTLAAWLCAPGEIGAVRARQDAVRELSGRLDLREDLAVLGEDVRSALDDRSLAQWGARSNVEFYAGARWIALLLGAAAGVAGVAWLAGAASLRPLLYIAVVELLFVATIRKPVGEITGSVNTPARELKLVAELLERLEREEFRSEALVQLRGRLAARDGGPATGHIRRLVRLVEWKEWAHNQVFGVIAAPLLWVPQFAMAIERWRQECGPSIGDWVAAVGEFEALASLAAFAFERPDAVFPELLEGAAPVYEARGLSHPLIDVREAVANDVALGGDVRLWIVSGSNMAGKSTLLRAVGLGVAMAWGGAPVTAGSLRVSRLRVGASIRVNDSLADHKSRFFAEISRLKEIVDLAGAGGPVLFLLDELLSGTNSHDRQIGADGLLRGLLERGAIGLASTHDLALAGIADALGERARNVHFEDQFEGGKMAWDYRLRPGVVERGNALELMRAVGLDV